MAKPWPTVPGQKGSLWAHCSPLDLLLGLSNEWYCPANLHELVCWLQAFCCCNGCGRCCYRVGCPLLMQLLVPQLGDALIRGEHSQLLCCVGGRDCMMLWREPGSGRHPVEIPRRVCKNAVCRWWLWHGLTGCQHALQPAVSTGCCVAGCLG
jgi:hypothetical protein